MRLTASIFGDHGLNLLGTAELDVSCGDAFCDTCGDCLSCYIDDPCRDGDASSHYFVVYEEDLPAWFGEFASRPTLELHAYPTMGIEEYWLKGKRISLELAGRIVIAADRIAKLYLEHGECVGGMLRVQLDDENLEDVFFEDTFPEWLLELHDRQPLEIEREIVERMRALSIDARIAAIELAKAKIYPERRAKS